ncbi:hypothetical protein DBR32_13755 [Taibaiella sp. KBW10]|uniref:GldL-related protein n=1 Tax=Taibaiella sp. KBW10 TaxID=2153357 RepID=UPI000F59C9DF|nr:hypothetical protein [Taibaiella sp. KBW10]RQO29974.1 hypothetical protein DBR32_13755 [Taibaiella sp. KBW10]
MKTLIITAIILTAVGIITNLIGALFKLEHLPGAAMLLMMGLLTEVAGVVLLAVYFVRRAKKYHNKKG